MILVPVGVYFILIALLNRYFPQHGEELIFWEALFFASLVGTLFWLSFLISGGITEAFGVVKRRISELFENLRVISAKISFKWYFEDLASSGIVFWLYLIPFLAYFTTACITATYFIKLYLA